MLGTGSKNKVFLDDVFSTYIYTENDSAVTVNNGVDMTEGGMVWFKNRGSVDAHVLVDTVRGGTKVLHSSANSAESTQSGAITSFNNNGFAIGDYGTINGGGTYTFASWSFRKAKGFFTISTWTGDDGTNRAIPHDLGSIPGMVIVKNTSNSYDWSVWHREVWDTTNYNSLKLNSSDSAANRAAFSNVSAPTSSNFYVRSSGANVSGQTYVAYVFAGGESTAATARSVDFDGTGDFLWLNTDTDLTFGTGAFTIEFWFKVTSNNTHQTFIADWEDENYQIEINTDGKCQFAWGANSTSYWSIVGSKKVSVGTWNHIAVVRNGNVFTQYLNGIFDGSFTSSTSANTNALTRIGKNVNASTRYLTGQISNLRIVKGTAVYTSSFRPPTEPLTNITNTVLLCCNNSSITGATVTPGTLSLTSGGNPTASTDSPFDDPAGFVFGESGSENVIKCGSYKGSSSAGLEVNVGWEPSWLMIKVTSRTGDWYIMDSIRGVVTSGNEEYLKANENDAEGSADVIEFTSTGFKVISTGTHWNNSAETYSFTAIRRSDGYCGKPSELGTDVFAMDTGAGSSTIPNFDSGFPVDWAITRAPAATTNWETGGRLIQGKWLETNNTVAESSGSYFTFDSNTGWMSGATAYNSSYQAWMWKRHAGLDVVTYAGSEMTGGRQIPHSMGVTPEMMWVFRRNGDDNWAVYHKGLNGSTNPEQYDIHLNLTNAEANNTTWNDTAPTATHFSVSPNSNEVNQDNKDYIAMLFASVSGISSVGSYTGPNPEATITIDCGFQPRFVMIKCSSHARDWVVFDTVRGIAAGADKKLALNLSTAQVTTEDMIDLTSSGFSLPHGTYLDTNWAGREFIYYAHA